MSKVLVETSARHVHVSEKDLETLFGPGYQLTVKKMLSQPGQYACAERVDVVGEKKTLTMIPSGEISVQQPHPSPAGSVMRLSWCGHFRLDYFPATRYPLPLVEVI